MQYGTPLALLQRVRDRSFLVKLGPADLPCFRVGLGRIYGVTESCCEIKAVTERGRDTEGGKDNEGEERESRRRSKFPRDDEKTICALCQEQVVISRFFSHCRPRPCDWLSDEIS